MTANVHIPFWFFCSVIGLPGEEDWPRDVALPRQAFQSKSAQPIEKFVTDIDELGKDLLLVSSRNIVGRSPLKLDGQRCVPQPHDTGGCGLPVDGQHCVSQPHGMGGCGLPVNFVSSCLFLTLEYLFYRSS